MRNRYRHKRRKYRVRIYNFCVLLLLCIGILFISGIAVKYFITSIYEWKVNSNNGDVDSDKSIPGDNTPSYKKQLQALRSDFPQVQSILDHINLYPQELLELAVKNHEAINFVAHYIEHSNSNKQENDIVIDNYIENEIPLFLQWDTKWGYDSYGDGLIAIDGCGPTALSMVIVGLTGDTSVNPKVVADYSYKTGHLASGNATSWTLMSEGSKEFGITPAELPLSENTIIDCLKEGKPIIASMRSGDFTTTGHYIVMAGVTEEGKIIINDPNSIKRSGEEWTFERLQHQIKNLWSFSNEKKSNGLV